LREADALTDRAVACLALHPGLCVLAMIEPHITWDLIYPQPIHFTALFSECCEFPLRVRFRRYCRMTLPALAYFRHVYQLARVAICVTQGARLFQIRHVQLMIELDRLLWPWRLAGYRRHVPADSLQEYQYRKTLHRFPVRICSAI
jgi:hypothetical protein